MPCYSIVPALWKGRIRPLEVAAAEWSREMGITNTDPSSALWQSHYEGMNAFKDEPIFILPSGKKSSYANLKNDLHQEDFSLLITGAYAEKYLAPQNFSSTLKQEIFPSLWTTYDQGEILILSNPTLTLLSSLKKGEHFPLVNSFEKTKKDYSRVKTKWLKLLQQISLYERWKEPFMPLRETLHETLKDLQDPLVVIPTQENGWVGLSSLKISSKNFTAYTDPQHQQLVQAYQNDASTSELVDLLSQNYLELAGTTTAQGFHYPSLLQLYLERLIALYPWHEAIIALYLLSAMLVCLWPRCGIGLLACTFCLHSFLLLSRWVILERPPVSNMVETVIYVPWVSVLLGLILSFNNRATLIAASLTAAALLATLPISHLESGFENVQPVLNSQYWLTIHVLMVVGSYGAFFLAAVLAHLYLFFPKQFAGTLRPLLISVYCGTTLLIAGTILGGVWAAQSWGRFWDWDPKESWAFITCCAYLILIHAHRFRWIAERGLAMGAIAGILFVSFTWYGVNYILGTGLHSYGFGSGGELLYFGFVVVELGILLKKSLH